MGKDRYSLEVRGVAREPALGEHASHVNDRIGMPLNTTMGSNHG